MLARLIAVMFLIAAESQAATVDLTVYAPDSPVHDAVVPTDVTLPEGWSITENNGVTYFIGDSKVYGSLTLTYSENGIANYSSQFGMPDPPKQTVDGEEIRFVPNGSSGTYSRKIGYTWFIKASVSPYPDYKDEDLTELLEEFLIVIASAKPNLPEVE